MDKSRKIPSSKAKSNKIGNSENQENRFKALEMLDRLTGERKKNGWVWVKRGTTQKQIHPDKLKAHLDDGWKKTS